jgi:hypothetical protein
MSAAIDFGLVMSFAAVVFIIVAYVAEKIVNMFTDR